MSYEIVISGNIDIFTVRQALHTLYITYIRGYSTTKACGSHLTLFAMHLMGRMKFHKSAWKPMRRFSGFDTNLERSHKTFSFYCVHDTHTSRRKKTIDRQNFGKKRFLSMIGDIPRFEKKEWLVEVKELVAVKLHWPSKMRIYSWELR